jgi:pimeloyl-ACP methyl ester carboxylesterase
MKKYFLIFSIFLLSGKLANAQADLTIIGGVSVVAPNPIHVGITLNVTFSVKNIGNGTAAKSNTGIYLSPTQYPEAGKLLSKISLESLATDSASNNIQFNYPIPYDAVGVDGTFFVIVKLNDGGGIVESSYSNNSANTTVIANHIPWAAQNLPYPIIFVHGYMSDNTTWNNLISDIKNTYGWSYGGNVDFCLNYDGNNATSDVATDYHDFTGETGHELNPNPCDYYTVNFKVNPNGLTPYNNSFESNQAAIAKQGVAIQDAIKHVLSITSKNKVVLVCHSMGGLAAREYLQNDNLNQASDGGKHVAKLCTIGTPHGGTNITANFLSLIWSDYDGRSEAIRDLRTGYAYSYYWPFGAPDPDNDAPGTYLFWRS